MSMTRRARTVLASGVASGVPVVRYLISSLHIAHCIVVGYHMPDAALSSGFDICWKT